MIELICAGIITIVGNAQIVELRGFSQLRPVIRMEATVAGRIYEDETQIRLSINADRKHVWINGDIDDRPGRGDRYSCKRR